MKKVKVLVNIILVMIFIFSLYKLADTHLTYKKATKVYQELQEVKESIINDEEVIEDSNTEGVALDLSGINEDYFGWITIYNTNINYPILQGEDNEYYLSKNINKEDLSSGSIVLDYRNNSFNDKNTIIYGHCMKNNTMFGQLKNYTNEAFFHENKYIYIFTRDGETLKYEIFSVYLTDITEDYLKTTFEDEEEYLQFINDKKNKSLFNSDVELKSNDKIVTLSTCSFEYENARLVVMGKFIE